MILSSASFAQDQPPYTGTITIRTDDREVVLKDLPKFEDYSAEDAPSGKIAPDIDFKSYEGSWNYRTRLRAGLKAGANFNGHYAVVTHGCGSSCQMNWIVDVTNGRVVDQITTTAGIAYRKDSSLIAANLEPEVEHFYYMQEVNFYRVQKGRIELVKGINLTEEIQK